MSTKQKLENLAWQMYRNGNMAAALALALEADKLKG